MVSKKQFISQEICYITGNFERKLYTVSANIKEFFSILEIENKNVTDAINERHQLNEFIINLLCLLMAYKLPINLGKLIIQNVQYRKSTALFWMSYFRIISRNHSLKILYMKMVIR